LLSEAAVLTPVRRMEAYELDLSGGDPGSGGVADLERIASGDSGESALSGSPWALQLVPVGPGFGDRRTGFLRTPTRDTGIWAVPRMADPQSLARLLLAYPHLTLVQTIEPLSDRDMELARGELDAALGGGGSDAEEFLGTPLRAKALVVAHAAPWTLPLRIREHLRGWFSAVELEEAPLDLAPEGVVVPEMLAAGMLRLPATVENSFPGLRVEPRMVPYEGETVTVPGIRAGAARTIRDELCDIVLTDEVLSRHIHVIGETGSGKSTLLTALALETAARGQGLLFMDPHGTTVDRILRELDPEARDRVWLIRCGDTANPVRLNPFAVSDPGARDLVIGDMAEAFQQLFDPNYEGIVGPRFQRIMRNTLSSLSEVRGERTSLLDVPRVLEDDDLARLLESRLTDPTLKTFWRNDFFGNRSAELNEIRAWVSSKFNGFTSNAAMRAILGTGADSFDPARAMTDNRIILLDLAKGEVGITGSRVIGMLYLLRFWAAALTRPEPHPFTLFVDEAGSFSSVPLSAILAEGRKFGLRAVIAHQFMGQLVGDLLEAVEGSVATRTIFRVGHDDARSLALATHPEFGPLDLTGLPQFTAATRLADTGYPLRPFTLEVDHNERVAPQADATPATQEIRDRTIRELVEPLREAMRMEHEDLSSEPRPVSSRTPRPGPSGSPFRSSSSFLDEWLAARRKSDASGAEDVS
jgi:energy-coupling factor transporter ATP-binding protein EcfA2